MGDDTEDEVKRQLEAALDEARRARSLYDDLKRSIEEIQGKVKADETLVAQVKGVRVSSIGVSGSLISFGGGNDAEIEVNILQHYSQVSVTLYKARPEKGEKPRPIGFLGEIK